MSVVPFRPRDSAQSDLTLALDEFREVTHRRLPEKVFEDEETGALLLDAEQLREIAQFFNVFGMRLPQSVTFDELHAAWAPLWHPYGQAVRLVAQGNFSDETLLKPLNLLETEYVKAVGEQRIDAARRLARRLFTDQKWARFLA